MPVAISGHVEVKQDRAIREAGEGYMVVANNDNLVWTESELDVFFAMWEEGRHVRDIAAILRRPESEVGYLIIYLDTAVDDDQSRKHKSRFKRRSGGAWGEEVLS